MHDFIKKSQQIVFKIASFWYWRNNGYWLNNEYWLISGKQGRIKFLGADYLNNLKNCEISKILQKLNLTNFEFSKIISLTFSSVGLKINPRNYSSKSF